VTGVTIWPAIKLCAATNLQDAQFVKRASFALSAKETTPAIPGHGNGPLLS
jgi:hypothetical protein